MPCYGVFNRAAETTTVNPLLGFTENGSLTYWDSGDPFLDFFFHVVPGTRAREIITLLEKAWYHNPLTTLKLIFNLRAIRGTGKSDKEGFFTCALWLYHHFPNTLALNLEHLPRFGCFKDLVEILFRLLEGPNVRHERRHAWQRKKKGFKRRGRAIFFSSRRRFEENKNRKGDYHYHYEYGYDYDYDDYDYNDEKRHAWLRKKKGKGKRRPNYFLWGNTREEITITKKVIDEEQERMKEEKNRAFVVRYERSKVPREKRVRANLENAKQQRDQAREERKKRVAEKAKRALEMYDQDPNYRFLYNKVSEIFARYLRLDLKWLNSGELRKISLASKWCPSIDSAYDKTTLICESIARRVFPRKEYPEYEGLEDAHYAYRVRDRLRKEVLVPLHKALEMPEIYIGANQWGSLPYKRVPSGAMKRYKNLFRKHDNKRFLSYLEDVEKGNAKIAAGALLPHLIIASLDKGVSKVAELQWKRMVEDLKARGKLMDSIAVCDVSGSMRGTPMEVCVALGLLISELSSEPWRGKVITFSENPEFHLIKGDDLKSKTEFIRKMEWGYSTDFQKVFDQILKVAIESKLDQDQMVKRIFVFSDMEFDQASRVYDYSQSYSSFWSHVQASGVYDHSQSYSSFWSHQKKHQHAEECKRRRGWETDYDMVVRKFKEKGFQEAPEIVFWNLRHSEATPVTCSRRGAVMLSGFSKNLMKLFLDKDVRSFAPTEAMELAIASEEYQKLLVYDRVVLPIFLQADAKDDAQDSSDGHTI